jgi:hypothetical protein
VTSLLLYGVAELEGGNAEPLTPGTSVVAFRDVGAVVAESEYKRQSPGPRDVEAHRGIVETVCARRSFLPAPVGVVFRSGEGLVRWLELHYVTLRDGLTFVEGRHGARVHLSLRDGKLSEDVDVSAVAAEAFRHFRAHAAASAAIRTADAARHASAAFLVERERWEVFVDMVKEEARHHPSLRFEHTGPWPPYDFVNMQFGI